MSAIAPALPASVRVLRSNQWGAPGRLGSRYKPVLLVGGPLPRWLAMLAILVVLPSTWCVGQEGAGHNGFLQQPPLSSASDELVAWAESLENAPKPEHVIEREADGPRPDLIGLLEQTTISLEEDGTLLVRRWTILKVLTRDGASYAGEISAEWSDWRNDKPEIRSRTVTRRGEVIEADGSTAFEQSASDGSGAIHTDARRLVLLLNGVEPGSLVETVIVTRRKPLLGSANSMRQALTSFSPSRLHRLVIESPPKLSPMVRSLGVAAGAEHDNGSVDKEIGNKVWEFEIRDPKGIFEDYLASTGPDAVGYPLIEVTLPGDWGDLGRSYAQEVDRAIESGKSMLASIAGSAPESIKSGDESAKIKWCKERVHRLVRYTGIEFGAQRILPYSPDIVVQRRFGDCKDQATLFVGLLREFGIEACVALLSSGGGLDTPAEYPSLNYFDHAIAYLPASEGWVDLTAEDFPLEMLPSTDSGRRALLCLAEGGRLVQTPALAAGENQFASVHEIHMNFSGGAQIDVNVWGKGEEALRLAAGYTDASPKDMLRAWKGFMSENYGAEAIDSFQYGAVADEYLVQCRSNRDFYLDRESFTLQAEWNCSEVVDYLPAALAPETSEDGQAYVKRPPRPLPLVFELGVRSSDSRIFYLPHGIEPIAMPDDWKIEADGFRFAARHAVQENVPDLLSAVLGADHLSDWQPRQVLQSTDASLAEAVFPRCVVVTYELEITPGTVTTDEANRLIGELNQQFIERDGTYGRMRFAWQTMEDHAVKPSNQTFSRLLSDAQANPELLEPLAALACELGLHGLPKEGQRLVESASAVGREQALAQIWLSMLLATHETYPYLVQPPKRDYVIGIYQDQDLYSYSARLSYLTALLWEDGLLTDGEKKLRQALELMQGWGGDEDVLPSPDESTVSLLTCRQLQVALALHDDDAAMEATKQFASPISQIVAAVLTNKKPRRDYSGFTGPPADRIIWAIFAGAGRQDLVDRFVSLVDDEELDEVFSTPMQKLEPLDPTDLASVARYAVRAIMQRDEAQIAELVWDGGQPDDYEVIRWQLEQLELCILDTLSKSRLLAATQSLMDDGIARLEPDIELYGEHCASFGLAATEDRDEELTVRLDLFKQRSTGEWKAAFNGREIATALAALQQEGLEDDIGSWLAARLPKPPNAFLALFSPPTTAIPGEARLWHSLDADDEQRVPLVVGYLQAWYRHDHRQLDAILADGKVQLKDEQLKLLRELNQRLYSKNENWQALYELEMEDLEARPSVQGAFALIRCLEAAADEQSVNGEAGSLLDERWQQVLEDYLDETAGASGSQITDRLQASMAYLKGDSPAAVSLLLDSLEKYGTERQKNSLLWKHLVWDLPEAELEACYEKLVLQDPEHLESASAAYLHTVACVEARLGRSYDALLRLPSLANPEGEADYSNPLLRAMILESLSFDDIAAGQYKQIIDFGLKTELSAIARAGLRRLAAATEAEG